MENEKALLEAAIERFNTVAGVDIEVAEARAGTKSARWDAVLWLKHSGKKHRFLVEIKKGVTTSTAHLIARRLRARAREQKTVPLLITDYVTEGVGEMLREMDVQYLDAAGNAHVHAGGVHILIEGKKRTVTAWPTRTEGDPFGWAGLKVVFALLCAQELRNATYRHIAKAADVALGTVGGVVTQLERRQLLMRVGGEMKLRNQKELLQQWVTAYATKLRPKLLLGRFDAIDGLDTHEAIRYGALLGAETGAKRLQRYLKPGIDTLYITGDMAELFAPLRLRPDPEGSLELRRQFWEFEYPERKLGTVPPLLIYADLISVGDPRTIEAAEMIYDECLTRYFGKT
ncbi:MAG: type IV toxin-antitoxin system AbiEi family antitoxin [Bacteroidota bacterium]|nr:type IV toxin-antitoxin system AbiEi family antitoxin [Bacteroidota bacterium]